MRESDWSSDVCSSDLFPSHDISAEEVAREIKAVEQKKEPHKKGDKLYIPEQDEMAKKLMEVKGYTKVQFDQSTKKAKAIIEIKGDPSETTPILKEIFDKLAA